MAKKKLVPRAARRPSDGEAAWRTEYWPHLFALRQAAIDAKHGLQGAFDIVPPHGPIQQEAWRCEFIEGALRDVKAQPPPIASAAALGAICRVAIPMLRIVADWQEQKQGNPCILSTKLDGATKCRPEALVRSLWEAARRLGLADWPPLPTEPMTPHSAMAALEGLAGACGGTKSTKRAVELKKSTAKGEGQVTLIAALTKHHQYAASGCMNLEPIGNNELARQAGVSASTASEFFNKWFNNSESGGHGKYRAKCRDARALLFEIKAMNGEFTPVELSQMTREAFEAGRGLSDIE